MMEAAFTEPEPNQPIRVLVVDDSAMVRQLLTNLLNRSGFIEVVDSAVDAKDAREKIKRYNPDVITLDIEMPGMDGLSFLEKIMKLRPMPVVMCSTLTEKGAEASLRALSIGAVDFVTKPKTDIASKLNAYADELVSKIQVASKVRFRDGLNHQSAEKICVQKTRAKPKLVAIGSSTGGTVALEKVLVQLPPDAPPIVIAQHIPAGFSRPFAQRVNMLSRVQVLEAQHGDTVEPGKVLIAPGGSHMRLKMLSGKYVCALDNSDTAQARHKPSVDIMFDSLVDLPASQLVAVLLTGMGSDGAKAMKTLHDRQVHTIAQDEKSSVVWGMPRRAVELGAVSEVVSLQRMAARILAAAY